MSIRVGAGISTAAEPPSAAGEAAGRAAEGLSGARPELALLFASGSHLHEAQALLDGIEAELAPLALAGCGAGGVLGEGREHESGSAVAVLAIAFDGGGTARTFRLDPGEEGLEQLPVLAGCTGALLLADPYTFPTELALAELSDRAPGIPVLGGLASARTDGGTPLFYDGQLQLGGAVAVTFKDVELLPCVSQGAAPLGRELTITAAEGNLIHELAGQPALAAIRQVIGELSPRERMLIASGLLVGIVIDSGKPEFVQGDFLVRGVLGADPDSGAVAVAAPVRAGQVIRLHARDARSADDDLRRALRLQREALSGRAPAGALVFSCNGRGRAMFGARDHDASVLVEELGEVPSAGFFAAGEIGPVGGRSFLHGFTATIAAFV